MKNVKFYSINQNVYIEYTGIGSRVFQELYCIAVGESEAAKLVLVLNFARDKDSNFYL